MDLKVLLSTFGLVFLAEMGDKTQLATMALAAGTNRWAVFLGAAGALVATSAVAVLAGELVARHVDPAWIHRAAGVLFLVLGVWYLVRAGR